MEHPPVKKKPPIIKELESLLNTPVIVKLKNGKVMKGTLKAFEPAHMNIVLYGVSEIYEDNERKFEKVLIRGDSIEYIAKL